LEVFEQDLLAVNPLLTIGYYIGGMKEEKREAAGREARVLLASYAMASEALDIKTLTTLIMATPKTDIEQSVGRILREKHSSPIVVDIIDSHDLFKNQWRKRKTFYKKENYKIIYTISTDYTTDLSTWTLIYDSKSKVCKPRKKKVISIKSNSSSDKSIANDSESEDDNEEPEPASKKASKIADDVCFLKC
jgi:superfamily II DNA or RNA helicase